MIAENTGFSDHVPTGNGLLSFTNMEEAVECVKEIDSNYKKHMMAARGLAEDYFTHKKVLPELLNSCME